MNVHYSVLIQWSDEDQYCYIASLPEFGPYTHTHGESYEEALKNAKEVLALLTEDMSALPNPQMYRVAEALAA
jgi:predicted RNase H-like HicB family nuclease